MKKTLIWLGILLLLALVCAWGYGFVRRIDGRSAADWLAFAARANRMVACQAEGTVTANGHPAHFRLEQNHGCYRMTTRDRAGRECALGYDGHQLWCSNGGQGVKVGTWESQPAPAHICRLLGAANIAGRPTVRLAVHSGLLGKTISIDRGTGVVLAMTTTMRFRPVSVMRVETIAYRPVVVGGCRGVCRTTARPSDLPTLERLLGTHVLLPQWLPREYQPVFEISQIPVFKGFTPANILVTQCPVCGMYRAVLRYTDGVNAFTLFEQQPCTNCCATNGCCQTATNDALLCSRNIGKLNVTIVGDLSPRIMKRVLEQLR